MSSNARRRCAALLLTLTPVISLTACGDDESGDDGASAADYVAAGNALCTETAVALDEAFPGFDGEPTISQVMELGANLGPVLQTFRDGVAALDPPTDLEEGHDELLDALAASITTLEEMATTEAGAQAALDAGGPPLDEPSTAANALFPECPAGDA